VFPGVPSSMQHSQLLSRDTVERMLRTSPRATIGRSPRNTAEYVAPASQVPGVGKYNPNGRDTTTLTKGHTFGSSPRMNYHGRQVRSWIPQRQGTPGPADYRPHRGYDSTFQHG
jgi:hypothetical protein